MAVTVPASGRRVLCAPYEKEMLQEIVPLRCYNRNIDVFEYPAEDDEGRYSMPQHPSTVEKE